MKVILRYLFLLCFLFGLVLLGYFAYKVSSDTLDFAFVGQEQQEGNALIIAVNHPSTWSKIFPSSSHLIDNEAVKQSLYYNGKPLLEVSPDFISVNTGTGIIHVNVDNLGEQDNVLFSSQEYNRQKKTSYRFPSDILLRPKTHDKKLVISEKGNPKEKVFSVELFGYDNLSAKDIRWYVYYPHNNNSCFDGDFSWNPNTYKSINVHQNFTNTQDGIERAEFFVDYNSTNPKQCLIAGLGGNIIRVLDREVDNFSINEEIVKVLTPNDNLTSQIEFNFSSPIISEQNIDDTEKLKDVQNEILEKLMISPEIHLSSDNISIAPKKITIKGEFQEGKKYIIHLTDMEDVFGQMSSTHFEFTPKNLPFLALGLQNNKNIFYTDEDIIGRIFAVSPKKQNFALKICRLDADGFFQANKIVQGNSKEYLSNLYALMQSSHSSQCVKNDITLSQDGMVTSFTLRDFFSDKKIKNGLYILAFRNLDDILEYENIVFPQVFSVSNSTLVGNYYENGSADFLVLDSKNGHPRPNQKISFSYQISDELNNEDRNILNYSTGQVLGRTNHNGLLSVDMGQFQEDISGKNMITFSRGNGNFGYILGKNIFSPLDDNEIRSVILTDKEEYEPGETAHIHAIVKNFGKSKVQFGETFFRLSILDSYGKEMKNIVVKPNSFGTILMDYQIPKNLQNSFLIQVAAFNNQNSKIFATKKIPLVIKQERMIDISVDFRAMNIENDSPMNLRQTKNIDDSQPWYEFTYSAPIRFEIIVHGKYLFGNTLKNTNFAYKLFRKNNDISTNKEENRELLDEGKSKIDSDGLGYVIVPSEFSSLNDDFTYQIEVSIQDPATKEYIIRTKDITLRLPKEYKTFDDRIALKIIGNKQLIPRGDNFDATIVPSNSIEWSDDLKGKYAYNLYQYRVGKEKSLVFSGVISDSKFSLKTGNLEPGEYEIETFPIVQNSAKLPKNTYSKTFFFVKEKTNLYVTHGYIVTDKEEYNANENIKISILSPFLTGSVLLTTNNSNPQLFHIAGNGLIETEVKIDDKMAENYIFDAVIFSAEKQKYMTAHKTVQIQNVPQNRIRVNLDRSEYNKGDTAQLNIAVVNNENKGIPSELQVIVKEGNDSFLSYSELLETFSPSKNILGETFISSNFSYFGKKQTQQYEHFQKKDTNIKDNNPTFFFSGSIITDKNGKARLTIPLLGNAYNYTVEVLSQSGDDIFTTSKKHFTVRQDFIVSSFVPEKVYQNDTLVVPIFSKNFTDNITKAETQIIFGNADANLTATGEVILNIGNKTRSELQLKIPDKLIGYIPYTVNLVKDKKILSTVSGNLLVEPIPNTGMNRRIVGDTRNNPNIILSPNELYNREKSLIDFRVASDIFVVIPGILEEIHNTKTTAVIDILKKFLGEGIATEAGLNSPFIKDKNILSNEFNQWIISQNFMEWKEKIFLSDSELLDAIILLLRMKQYGFLLPSSWISEIQEYKNEIKKSGKYKNFDDESIKILFISALLGEKSVFDEVKKVETEKLSPNSLVNCIEVLKILGQKIPEEMWEQVKKIILQNNQKLISDDDSIQKIGLAHLLFLDGKTKKSREILIKVLENSPHDISSLSQKVEILKAVVEFVKISKSKNIPFVFEALGVQGKGDLSAQNPLYEWSGNRNKFHGNIHLKSPKETLYYELREKNILQNPESFPEMQSENLKIIQTIEKIKKENGVNEEGEFIFSEPLKSNEPLDRGNLYRIKTQIIVRNANGKNWSDLFVKIPIIGAGRVWYSKNQFDVNDKSKSMKVVSSENNKIILQYIDGIGNQNFEYSYYFEPKISGNYLLPATFVYFKERKEFFANTMHKYLHIN